METAQLVLDTLAWLGTPSTWASVLGPAACSLWALSRDPLRRSELLLLAACLVPGAWSARLATEAGVLSLYSQPWLLYVILAGACSRRYIAAPAKAFALCWLYGMGVDLLVMVPASHRLAQLHLPQGIGGAGFGDALFIDPVVAVLGLWLLRLAREWDASRRVLPKAHAPWPFGGR